AGYFAALGRSGSSALLSLSRGFVLLPAALLVFYALGGGTGIWLAALTGEAVTLALGLILLYRVER
ncbi:MAG: MATE family efflux transporter, partial [Evtepia sp.]